MKSIWQVINQENLKLRLSFCEKKSVFVNFFLLFDNN